MPGARPRILLVDDEEPIRVLLERILTYQGYEAILAADGAEAVQAVFSESPDAVVTDLVMPVMDGFAFIERIRSRVPPARLPIIVASALGHDEAVARAFRAGATDYLRKPFRGEDLLARVQVALRRIDPAAVDALENRSAPPDPAPTFAAGSFLDWGKYRVLGELGSGGMARIYRAVHVGYGHEVALKVLDPELVENREDVFRFLREVRLSLQADHPNIVRVYDMGFAGPSYYYAMESLPGPSLQEEIEKGGPLDGDRVIGLGLQVGSAIAYLHDRRILHRDVKPSNVLYAAGGVPKLTDFGLACQLEDPRVTRIGTFVGTPGYVAPEAIQASSRDLDPRSDVYGLGTTLYFAAAGREAYPDRAGEAAQLRSQILEAAEDPRRANPRIPKELSRVILRMMERDPANRYPRVKHAIADLRKLQPAGK